MSRASDPLNSATASPAGTGAEQTRHGALLYCLVLVLVPLLAIPAFIALGRSDFFLRHGASVWVRSNDAVFAMHDRQCDVLVFGDSTAMTGIDPEVVESRTGFRTCNIAVTNAVLAVTNNMTLSHFLAHNAKPHVLLVQLSPDDFQSESYSWRRTVYAEGLVELLRHASPAEARQVLFSHPQESIAFAGYAAGFSAWYGIKDAWFHATRMRAEEDTVTVRNGFFTPPLPARTTCVPAASVLPAPSERQIAFSRALVAEYEHGFADEAGVVLVNVAPIPACDQNLATYAAELKGLTSNALLALPIGLFNDGRHYTARGSEVVSTLVAGELNAVAQRNPSIDDRLPAARNGPVLRRAYEHMHHWTRRNFHTRLRSGYGLPVFPHEGISYRPQPAAETVEQMLRSTPGAI